MTGRARRVIRVVGFLTRLVLATVSFLLVGMTVFFVAFGAAAIVTPSSSFDTIIVIAIVCAVAGGGLVAFGVWRVSGRRSARATRGAV